MNEEKYIVPTATFQERPEDYELKVLVPGVGKADAELQAYNLSPWELADFVNKNNK